ncbi:hypothetical protein GNZ06_19280 [Aeromonas jandaei]|uniref:hypothetical protein n=1 Tax=Aeromonas jandaei TaxID=650 RepID=UPI0019323338|nr:hypothetical protein [Aeromonas jandaei]MBM0493212.1 hypothetical protein [Aeromonas jandaei]MBM0570916.1 hypothetical protein [Aeromonas jandaei]
MGGHYINLFMWGYQSHYRIQIQRLARDVLKRLGASSEAEVILVGARSPNSDNRNPVCIEPEDGKWPLSLFDDLIDSIEVTYNNHKMQNLYFGDAPSMRDKPEWMRQDSVRTSVELALKKFDEEHYVTSFCGAARRIDDHYVTPVIQIPNSLFLQYPPLDHKPLRKGNNENGYRSLIHSAMATVLHEATEGLNKPEPGRSPHRSMREAEEIVRIAAKKFMHTPGLSIERQYMHDDLFATLNLVSSLMYEGSKGIGHLILVDPKNDVVEFMVKFAEPVTLHEPRWVRKVLQMATTGIGIIADSQRIYGLGRLKEWHDSSNQDAFLVVFIDHYHWELRCGNQALLRSHYAEPKLPQEPFDKAAFLANYARLFPETSHENGLNLWHLMMAQVRQEHGSMIVVAKDAASEARRLSKQGTCIEPTLLSEELLRSVSGIDGTIILDPSGFCHAIGIILDGEATEQCTPSRGSRYNSGVRYVHKGIHRRLAIVVSDDRTVDIIPMLRPLVSRSMIEQHVTRLENATIENFHDPRNWLDKHRFYLNLDQCSRVNNSLERLDNLPKEFYRLYFSTEKFEVHPEMDESYLTDV